MTATNIQFSLGRKNGGAAAIRAVIATLLVALSALSGKSPQTPLRVATFAHVVGRGKSGPDRDRPRRRLPGSWMPTMASWHSFFSFLVRDTSSQTHMPANAHQLPPPVQATDKRPASRCKGPVTLAATTSQPDGHPASCRPHQLAVAPALASRLPVVTPPNPSTAKVGGAPANTQHETWPCFTKGWLVSAFGCQGSALETAWKFNPSTTSGGLAWLGSPRIPGCRRAGGPWHPRTPGSRTGSPKRGDDAGEPVRCELGGFCSPCIGMPRWAIFQDAR